jgi:sugar diacid utilization regulator
VLALGAPPRGLTSDVGEVLHLASMATLTELAVAEGRADGSTENALGALFARLRSDSPPEPDEVLRWARRLGCDLAGGVVGLCAQLTVPRPRHVAAIIAAGQPGALVEHLEDRLYALLPNDPGLDARLVVDRARSLASQIKEYGVVGVSSHYDAPADIPRALQEAELVLEVVQHAAPHVQEQISGSSYRLLIRTMATHPDEVLRLYHSTVAAIVDYDGQYSTDLAHTLTTYLALDCNMRATAAAVYAHRHTVAYRLDRVRDLTGLDPSRTEDREQLGLGLKAHQVLAPRLPR